MSLKLSVAQESLRQLEEAIAETKRTYADAGPEALATYIAPMIEELDALRSRIDRHLELNRLREDAGLTWVTLRGGSIRYGKAPAHVVGAILEALQKGTRQIASWVTTGEPAISRVPSDIADEAELDLVAFQPGSARLAIAPSVAQLRHDVGLTLAERGFIDLLRTLSWAERGGDEDQLEEIAPNPRLRRQLLTRVRELAPSGRAAYEAIQFTGYAANRAVGDEGLAATGAAFDRSTAYLKSREEEEVTYRGKLVLIDVERDVFDLRYEQKRIHCHFSDELREAAQKRIDAFVEVEGTGFFRIEDEDPHRINVASIKDLSIGEIRNL